MARWQAAAFWLPEAQKWKNSWWSTPPLLSILHQRDFISPTPAEFQGAQDVRITRQDETRALAQALQCSMVQLGMSPGMLFGAIQEFHQCLTPLPGGSNLLDISTLDVAEKEPDPSKRRHPEPWEEESTKGLQA